MARHHGNDALAFGVHVWTMLKSSTTKYTSETDIFKREWCRCLIETWTWNSYSTGIKRFFSLFPVDSLSAFLLNGKTSRSGGTTNGTVLSTGIFFRQKRITSHVLLFPRFHRNDQFIAEPFASWWKTRALLMECSTEPLSGNFYQFSDQWEVAFSLWKICTVPFGEIPTDFNLSIGKRSLVLEPFSIQSSQFRETIGPNLHDRITWPCQS